LKILNLKFRCFVLMCIVFAVSSNAAKVETPVGSIEGTVISAKTNQALIAANVLLLNSNLGASTDIDGSFTINTIPAGVYSVQISMMGFKPFVQTDVVVSQRRINRLNIKLDPSSISLEEIVVRPEYFSARTSTGSTTAIFNREEVRRAPGSAEDVNRLVQSLPSVGMGAGDDRNDIIVRGGNPMENLFLVDGHPVMSINHFSSQGSTGGPIGMLHVDFIEDVGFSAGGFDARYGDRLSSVMDIRFRDGARDAFTGDAFMSMAGIGAELEGPINEGRGNWLIAFRRSYLELLKDQIGYATAPVFGDFSARISYDLTANTRIKFLTLNGLNTTSWTIEEDQDQNYSVDQTQLNSVFGFSIRHMPKPGTVDRARYTLNRQTYDQKYAPWNYTEEINGMLVGGGIENDSKEMTHTVEIERQVILDRFEFYFGTGVERALTDNNVDLQASIDQFGNQLPPLSLDEFLGRSRLWGFVKAEHQLCQNTSLRASVRADRDSYSENIEVQPRFAVRQSINQQWTLDFSAGLFTQNIPTAWLVQSAGNRDVESMRSRHLQAALEWNPLSELLISFEGFHRVYDHMPVSTISTERAKYPLADLGTFYGYTNLGALESNGKGRSYGLELYAQKKLSNKTYGSISYSWSMSKFKTPYGNWVKGPFDRRHMFTLITGWIPNSKWELSLKWRLMGGAPKTPLDEAASEIRGDTVYDYDQYQGERSPIYHRLDIRLDRRIHGKKMDLVMFWDLENAYDMKNESFEYWHHNDNKKKVWYGWRIMPVFGMTIEF
jgi:hypothetical protein